jgi:rSAM/selenodomain-associated transferase 2
VREVRISVVIPALNEAGDVENAIRSAAVGDAEVIVVDGGSRDETASRAAAAGARVVLSPPGRARQLERGRREATGDTVLFLHADSVLPEGFDEAVRAVLADARAVGGAFALRFDRRGRLLRLLEWGVRLRVRLFRLPFGDQGIFARGSVLESLGGVPQAAIMEDLDLVRALQRRGRFARLELPVVTSSRRYEAGGLLRTVIRNQLASLAWLAGVDRSRVAAWYRR